MARGINKVILVGNLGNDPETKYTQGGMAVTTISLATTSVRKDRDGNNQERTEWHRVKLFGKLGEIAGEYLRKGRQVYIEGSIRYDKFTGQDGVEKYFTDIIADEMQMLGGGESGGGGGGGRSEGGGRGEFRGGGGGGDRPARQYGGGYGGGRQESAPRREAPPAKSNDFGDDFADDDIPF
ncbi:single-stranded DNA-binding protein [Lysobacter firmicutimachus]|uniref:Single-stranded DNA-binding protein n=1 Tax=Lysobacter firmicutimachus TaxID=1792846 RepID=A0AAU8MRC2_9GAMM